MQTHGTNVTQPPSTSSVRELTEHPNHVHSPTHADTQGHGVQLASACEKLPGEQRVNTNIFRELISKAKETLAETENSVLAQLNDKSIGGIFFADKLNQAHNRLEKNLATLEKCAARMGNVTLSSEARAKAEDDAKQAYYSVNDELEVIKELKKLEGLAKKSLETSKNKISTVHVALSDEEIAQRTQLAQKLISEIGLAYSKALEADKKTVKTVVTTVNTEANVKSCICGESLKMLMKLPRGKQYSVVEEYCRSTVEEPVNEIVSDQELSTERLSKEVDLARSMREQLEQKSILLDIRHFFNSDDMETS